MEWVLFTGQPGVGKTTAVKRVVDALRHTLAISSPHISLSGFYTEEVLNSSGMRIGFDVVTIPEGKRGPLSRKGRGPRMVGKYAVDVKSFETLALPTISRRQNTIFVLDEVGRMELKSENFRIAVKNLLVYNAKLIGAITAPIYGHRVPFCDEIAAAKGVNILKLLKATRNEITTNLVARITSDWSKRFPARPVTYHQPILELYLKSTADIPRIIKSAVLPLNTAVGIAGVMLTFKSTKDATANPEACKILRKLLPPAIKIHTVWSSKFVKEKTIQKSACCLAAYAQSINRSGGNSILVVSGTGKRKGANSLSILQRNTPNCIPIGIAFNPFIGCRFDPQKDTCDSRRTEELARLKAKLEQSGCCSVWLQFGIDIDALQQGLDDLDTILKKLDRDVKIFGSVFIPSKVWVAKMKFRTWSGVYLGNKDGGHDSSGYFDGKAFELTKRVIDVYRKRNITPVIESAVRNARDVDACVGLFDSTANTESQVKRRRIKENRNRTGRHCKRVQTNYLSH